MRENVLGNDIYRLFEFVFIDSHRVNITDPKISTADWLQLSEVTSYDYSDAIQMNPTAGKSALK